MPRDDSSPPEPRGDTSRQAGAWPEFAEDEVAAAARVLRSGKVNYWTGREGRDFEQEFAAFVGARHAIALSNGTVALEVALKAAGVEPGAEVVTTPRSFIASASCAVVTGCRPVFADVDRDSQNITRETVQSVLTPRTRAIIAVHLAGWPCEMDGLLELARERGLALVEDCAQAHGARYRGKSVGSLGTAAAWSFCQDKIMTTAGEGGMLTTDDEALWRTAWSYKDHGKDYDQAYGEGRGTGYRWVHHSVGTNMRLSETQSAIGRVQLGKLPHWVETRRANARTLIDRWRGLEALRIPVPPPHIEHAYYKLYAFVQPDALKSGWSRDRIVEEVCARGVFCQSGICPEIYRERAFCAGPFAPAAPLRNAQELGMTSLLFLVHPTLTPAQLERTASVVADVARKAAR